MKRARKKPNTWADHYTKKARELNYPARSVFKLKEIQKKFAVLKKGQTILDLGCAPGSWLLFAAECTGPSGRIIGVDLKPVGIRLPDCVTVHQHDATDPDAPFWRDAPPFDLVLSDMAPATTGNRDTDVIRSVSLAETVLETAAARLKQGDGMVCKVFQGVGVEEYIRTVRSRFSVVKTFRPRSTRKASVEIFVIAKHIK